MTSRKLRGDRSIRAMPLVVSQIDAGSIPVGHPLAFSKRR